MHAWERCVLKSKHYCDITGLPSKYTDPKTGLRYHEKGDRRASVTGGLC